MCASMAVALSACGGGGGSPGTVPGQQPPGAITPTPASIVLATSSDTIVGSGADGTEVTVTAIVKDAGNNALSGVTVSFVSSSGTISSGSRVSDSSGMVTEKLSVKGDTTPRDITITAKVGGLTSNAKVVKVLSTSITPPKLLLTSSSGTLASAGELGTEVQIRALLIDNNNVVVPNVVVTFATNSGTLSASQVPTSASGIAVVNLNTGADPTTRTISVTASAPGTAVSTVNVNVVGTKIALNAAPTLNVGSTSDVTAVLTNSLGNPIVNQLMTVSHTLAANGLTVKSGGSAITDNSGKLVLRYAATVAGTDTITVAALGETATATITTVASDFTIASDLPVVNTNTCSRVIVRNFLSGVAQDGTVTISSSRGAVYTDSNCTVALNGSSRTLAAGLATVYVSANSPGVATLSATYNITNATVQGVVEFVAPLTAVSVVSLQATPAIVGANATGKTDQQSILRAVVTDKASQGNPVKGAKVAFSIISDPSGGSLSQPSEVITGSDGSATISYIAGTTTTAVDGVKIRAQVQSAVSTAFADAQLTVAQRSLFISAGTGNTIVIVNSSTYQSDYAVFVSDSAGNAVRDVTVTGAVRPRYYYKGYMYLPNGVGPWVPFVTATCANEDVDSDGVLGIGEDTNGNGRLDPVIPMNITSSGKTDAGGTATISMTYPKDRAYWIDVDFTIRGAVTGSEARYVGYTLLKGAAIDYKDATVAPPGLVSPYGQSTSCANSN
ncbi:MAG: Ig-like domain-containing protein [Pseudomonadota bacterium]